jgi:hypothetical protein
MRLLPAELVTPEAQVDGPVHSVSQLFPPQLMGPWQAPIPVQVTVFVAPVADTPPAQELVPLQVTLQVVPPHWIPPPHALSPQAIVQSVAPRQSIGALQPPAGQSIRHDIPSGQTTAVWQGEQPAPQAKVQTPFSQAPPAARQLKQAAPASGGPQAVAVVPASTPCPLVPAPDPGGPPRPPVPDSAPPATVAPLPPAPKPRPP